ncbi:acetolactate decarboxylase [Listeria monocytogenes]|uniref:acetolactate decarboxylase n=1 Tax=Listeria monocytogenes TaxID=1639 RepID=UPI00086ABD98|nr:acetolactate decarboxylase [Listeria monocytogenes]EAG6821133.1 acetolactate decarboxylase [Listeria monocytogenes]OEP90297.1 alpha-acetolactate decarboxylase [Listeria monocytogenes]OFF97328.1 alpha-acetolactate decarboxylase [Listeria monocytogenes]
MDAVRKNRLFQHSTMAALVGGLFSGTTSFKELLQHGDLGIGTLDQFDGELIILDGEAFQIRSDGQAYKVKPENTTPYASTTFFDADTSFSVSEPTSKQAVEEKIAELVQGPNVFYAVKMTGNFRYVDTRVVPKQQRPYPPLIEAVKEQPTYHFEYITGTIVGFWTPAYISGIGVSGYHVHFIDDMRKIGGHVFDYEMLEGTVEVAQQTEFELQLPQTTEFLRSDLSTPDMLEQIEAAEN